MEEMRADISRLNGKLRYFMNNLSQTSTSLQKTFQPFIEVIISDNFYFHSILFDITSLKILELDI